MAIGGICLMVTAAAGALIEPAHAQAQQLDGFAMGRAVDESYPQWARPYLSSGFNAGSNIAGGSNRLAYTARFGSGIVGIFLESNGRDEGAGASGLLFGPPTSLRQEWFGANLGNPAWRTSIFGSYKSEPSAALINGLYTTASFGVIRTNPPGFSGLTNFSAGNDAVGLTASAGLGLQLTPQISVEGGFTWTQVPGSAFR
jgi:hypothetical protein